MRYEVWREAKKELKKEWKKRGIDKCENCGGSFALNFHHIKRRSAGGGNEKENIILLCASCHHRADNQSGYVKFNKTLKEMAEMREAFYRL